MQVSLIVSVVGPDRPGLVDQIATVVQKAGGNWEGSRLVRLAGQFAGMIQVVIHESLLPQLEEGLRRLESVGLRVASLHSDKASATAEENTTHQLEVVGQDQSGIVSTISHALAEEGVNVIELATDVVDAPMTGERLFQTSARLHLPATIEATKLRARIEEIASDLMVELNRKVDSNP
ncbi:MAG: ACT domain-containing protein [Verrucomicrobiota bacterium]